MGETGKYHSKKMVTFLVTLRPYLNTTDLLLNGLRWLLDLCEAGVVLACVLGVIVVAAIVLVLGAVCIRDVVVTVISDEAVAAVTRE